MIHAIAVDVVCGLWNSNLHVFVTRRNSGIFGFNRKLVKLRRMRIKVCTRPSLRKPGYEATKVVCLLLTFVGRCFVFSFVMPKERSHRGRPDRPPRSTRSRAAARSVSSRSTPPLTAVSSCSTSRATLSGNATPSVVQVSADEAFSSMGLGCSREELLVLIREEF